MSEQPDLFTPGVSEAWPATLTSPLDDVRDRLSRSGPTALDEGDTLALLLAHGQAPGVDFVAAADALLARFGGIARILGAPEPELAQVIGAGAARDLGLLHGLLLRTLEHPLRQRQGLTSHEAVRTYLRVRLTALPRQAIHVLFLDRKNQLIADERMSEGTVDHAPVYPREVLRRALELSASGVLLAHNHPSGDPQPSSADVEMTRQIVAAAKALGVTIHDHFVVGGDQIVSLRSLGLM